MHVLIGIFGDSTLVVRLPSVLGAAATTGLVAALARRFFGVRCALAAGLLSAVSVPLVYYAQDARSYALLTTFVTASVVATALFGERGDRLALGAFVAATIVACYLSLVAALVVPVEVAALLYWRRWSVATRHFLLAVAGAAACCAPLAVLARRRGTGQLFWVPRPGPTTATDVANALASSAFTPNFHRVATSTALLVASAVTLTVAIGVVIASLRRARAAPDGTEARRRAAVGLLALGWFGVPVALELVVSLVAQPILLPRNVMVSLPAVALLLALACTGGGRDGRRAVAAGAFALGGLLVLRGLSLFPTYGTSPENWRTATDSVLHASRAGDCVVFYPEDGRMVFDYYLTRAGPAATALLRPALPTTPWSEVVPFVERYRVLSPGAARALASSCGRVWLVASHQGSSTGPAAARAHLAGYRSSLDALGAAYSSESFGAFGYSAPVDVTLFSGAAPAG